MRRFALCLLPLLLAAGPADKPVDRNSTEYTSPGVNARFRTPKTWARTATQGGDGNSIFVFDIAPKKKASSPIFQQFVIVTLVPAKGEQATLDGAERATRADIEKMYPGVKFTKDARITYAGRPAHTFHWTFQRKLTYANPEGGTSVSKVDTDRVQTVFVDHSTVCTFGMVADARFMPSLIPKAEPVAKSLMWDE